MLWLYFLGIVNDRGKTWLNKSSSKIMLFSMNKNKSTKNERDFISKSFQNMKMILFDWTQAFELNTNLLLHFFKDV